MNRKIICTMVGAVGSVISGMFGRCDEAIKTLLIFMAIDYISGLLVAGVFKTSNKTKSGTLQSAAGWRGLCKKGMTLLFVLIANRLDLILQTSYIRNSVVIAFMANELISIVENAGLMGVPIPRVMIRSIDVLKNREEEKEYEDKEITCKKY